MSVVLQIDARLLDALAMVFVEAVVDELLREADATEPSAEDTEQAA